MAQHNWFLFTFRILQGTLASILPRGHYQGKYRNWFHYGTEVLYCTHASPIVPKDSPLKDSLDKNLMWMRDTGVIKKMESDVFLEIALPPLPSKVSTQALTVLRWNNFFNSVADLHQKYEVKCLFQATTGFCHFGDRTNCLNRSFYQRENQTEGHGHR